MKSWSRSAIAIRLAPAALAALLLSAGPAHAQNQQQIQQIRQQIEAMGLENMEPAQVRQLLTQMGYDPTVLDSYLESAAAQEGDLVSAEAMRALEALTVQGQQDEEREDGERQREQDGRRGVQTMLPDSSEMEKATGLRVFGLATFARRSNEFAAIGSGPIPPGYVLGPGDEVVLILTGDVEEQYLLPVTREGFIVIPQAGQVWVNGLTVAELRDQLYARLGRVYSGISRGPEASINFQLSLGSVRSNPVFITGEVRRPGTYTTSAMASVLNALYQAGGPQPTGSFRDIRVLRNGEVVERIDLYAYLTSGDNLSNLILAPGDVIFIPPAGPQVALRGAVTREALYELRQGETLVDAIDFAGGLTAPAALGRARITRILPPMQRTEPGVDRTVVDVDLAAVARGDAPVPELYDGDDLRIFRIRPEVRKIVTVSGAIWKNCQLERQAEPQEVERQQERDRELERDLQWDLQRTGVDSVLVRGDSANGAPAPARRVAAPRRPDPPCTFHLEPGMRAWDLIEAAEGLRPDAYRQSAQIVRMDPADSTLAVQSFSLETAADGTPVENPVLREFDAVRIFSQTHFQDSLSVRLSGEVRHPGRGTFQYREGMTLEDLILEAGGLTPEADLTIEVSRRPGADARQQGQITETARIPVSRSYIISEEGIRFYPGDLDSADATSMAAANFELRPHDQVFVRRVPNLSETERTVRIQGEVAYPGVYALRSKDERLSELVDRAGGLTGTAFAGGFRLYRNGQLVNTELPEVLRRRGGASDVILLPGDSMVVPEYDPVVVVQGAVNSPAAVLYREGAGLDYYIANAGGYARNADRKHVNVRFANGEGAVQENMLLFTRSPRPGPGSVVNVPAEPPTQRDFLDSLGDVAQVAASVLTTLLLLTRF